MPSMPSDPSLLLRHTGLTAPVDVPVCVFLVREALGFVG